MSETLWRQHTFILSLVIFSLCFLKHSGDIALEVCHKEIQNHLDNYSKPTLALKQVAHAIRKLKPQANDCLLFTI